MNLNSKFLLGFIVILSIGFFVSIVVLNISTGFGLVILGISSTIIGLSFVTLLFSPDRIKGYQADYEASPDLTEFKVVKTYPERVPEPPKIPEVAYCSTCGKKIYKPFYCSICGQILCGTHYLSGSHKCKEEV